MSYCRWSDSDLYVYDDVSGYFICMNCPFEPLPEAGPCTCSEEPTTWAEVATCKGHPMRGHYTTTSRAEMIAHLEAHAARGESSDGAIPRLRHEIEVEGDAWKPLEEER